jgi:ribonuclease-3
MPKRILRHLHFLISNKNKDFFLIERLVSILGFKPGNIDLYKQAFRHSSVAIEIRKGIKNNNERLEYLGDAVLSAIVADYLFQQYPFKDEGFLTQLRSRIVNRNQLNKIATRLGLDEILQTDERNKIPRSSLYGNAFEALIGAVYLDQGYQKTRKFFIERILKFHLDIDSLEKNDPDFKSQLINFCQKEKLNYNFKINKLENSVFAENLFSVEIEINQETLVALEHPSKRKAEQLASQLALEKLNSIKHEQTHT